MACNRIVPRFCRQLRSASLQPMRCMSSRRDVPVRISPFHRQDTSPWHRSPWETFFGPSSRMSDLMSNEMREMSRLMDHMVHPRFFDAYFTRPHEAGELFKTEVAEVKLDKNQMSVKLDVHHYSPEELKVKIVGDRLVISGHHEQKADEHGYIQRQFTREFAIPDNIDPDTIKTSLTDEGMLLIKGTPKDAPKVEERTINIEKAPKEDVIPPKAPSLDEM